MPLMPMRPQNIKQRTGEHLKINHFQWNDLDGQAYKMQQQYSPYKELW